MRLAPWALLIVSAAWGLAFVVMKDAIQKQSVNSFLFSRFLVAVIAMVILKPSVLKAINREVLKKGFIAGLFLASGYILQTLGLALTGAAIAGFITGLYVVATPVIAALVLKVRINGFTWACVAMATVGLALLSLKGWNLGLGEPRFVSALHGRGSGDLLDLLIAQLPEVGSEQVDDGFRRVALVGRPNVGKSSLLNVLAGAPRVLVDDAEGTTRDAVDELIEFGGSTWRFIDTAGIRRRAHQASGTDYYASLRTQIALERAEVALVIFDASQILTEQDIRIVSMADEAGKALVIVMNKWDLVDEERQIVLDKEIERQLERYPWAQRVNLSAKTGWHRDRLAPALRTALSSWEKRIPTAKLNAFLGELVGANPPPVRGGKQPKIKFATQAGTCPPKFVVFATDFLESAYRRFIERRLREEFGFDGTPIEVAVKLKDRDNG